ncbi:MAG: TIGR00266 family protein [Candidatus Methanomethylophilaceae archaeon]|nr:TIGR00266 family protein [Candidatus Methanomethylophilaceae archaeon]MDD3379116.1 TIGR00266 family protein [Candidatus Methanomethylophilaceae archaeon]MDY0224515.1 TIGR00266 family protein [Candidatus Methanomethylophilaceae archaeon]
MRYTITGDNLQFVNVQLDDGEELDSQAGAMVYMTGNMTMEAKMKGGLMKGLGRSLTGSSLFLLKYSSQGGSGIVGLGGSAPGKIVDLDIGKGKWIVQKTGYLCSQPTVELKMTFQKKLGSILFGGEGLILQELSGTGMAFVAACGDFNIVDLKPGERYKVSTANAVAWQDSVAYDITAAGGIKTALFGGEGLFVTTLTGPGKIIIQSMTLPQLAGSLIPYLPSGN